MEFKEKYQIKDCYVYINLTEELITFWANKVKMTIKDIEMRESDYRKYRSDKSFWDNEKQVEKESYYFSTLCGYSRKLHKPFDEYCNKIENQKGIKNTVISSLENNSVVTNDLSWLNDI